MNASSDKPTLSEFQQKEVWEEWIGAETRSLYFAELARYYSGLQSWLTWATLLLASGASVTLLAKIAPNYAWITLVLAVLTAALSLCSVVMQNTKRYSDCTDLHFRWNRLALEYKALWNDMYLESAADELRKLSEKACELSKSSLAMPNRQASVRKWEDHVLASHGITA